MIKKNGRVIQNAKFNRGEMSNILRLGKGKKISQIHDAIFPETLPDKLIKVFSNKGDLIYDPFMGSGTTAKMAILNERKYIGSEISKEYCDMANERIPKNFNLLLDFW